MLIGLYDTNFMSTLQYKELHMYFYLGITEKGIWQHQSRERSYKLGLTKVSSLTWSALKCVHAVIA